MLRLSLLAALTIAAATATRAGGLDEPVMEPTVIEAETVSSSHDIILPIAALILIGTAISRAN